MDICPRLKTSWEPNQVSGLLTGQLDKPRVTSTCAQPTGLLACARWSALTCTWLRKWFPEWSSPPSCTTVNQACHILFKGEKCWLCNLCYVFSFARNLVMSPPRRKSWDKHMLTGPIRPYSRYKLHRSTLVATRQFRKVQGGCDIGYRLLPNHWLGTWLSTGLHEITVVDLITPPAPAIPTREYHSLSAMDPIWEKNCQLNIENHFTGPHIGTFLANRLDRDGNARLSKQVQGCVDLRSFSSYERSSIHSNSETISFLRSIWYFLVIVP